MLHTFNRVLRRGFTLIELLVVIAIIAVLIGLLIPFFGKISGQADKAAVMTELGGLQSGLQQYYTDLGMYPPSGQTTIGYGSNTFPPNGILQGRGSEMLAQGLMGFLGYKDDGAGPGNPINPGDPVYGFRTRSSTMGGRIYGPYASDNSKTYKNGLTPFFVDRWGNEILYFRSVKATANGITLPTPTKIFGLSTANPPDALFFYDDCNTTATGPINASTGIPAFFKLFTPGNTNAYTGGAVTGSDSYLLISAGPDGVYFTADDLIVGKP